MIHETFVADNPQSAYKLAVAKYGTEISLVSAKQIRYEDDQLRSEITVAVPSAFFEEISMIDSMDTKSEESQLLEEIGILKAQLDEMKVEMSKEMQSEHTTFTKVKSLFEKKGISARWIDRMFSSLMGSEIINDEALLASYLIEEIDLALEVKDEDLSSPKIMMMVGPTGVGKTTTVAKLAARYAFLLEKPYKVALVNLDTFKVGAIEQLGHYAKMMQIKHLVVDDVAEFQETLERLHDYDIILVDTAGMSPYDTEKFVQTVAFLNTDFSKNIEVNLVLSATVKYEDMEDIYQKFSSLHLNSVVISKFDETKHFGTLLNFMLLYHLPMSYFATGQEVPDDLIVADKEYLLEAFVGDIEEG